MYILIIVSRKIYQQSLQLINNIIYNKCFKPKHIYSDVPIKFGQFNNLNEKKDLPYAITYILSSKI